MDKKIRIALCLSGEPRSTMACFPYIYETFLKKNKVFETDVYIHSLKGFRAFELYNPKNYNIEYLKTEDYKSIYGKINHQVDQLLNNKINKNFTTFSNTLTNQLLMFYSIQKSFNLIQETYDVYVRMRYDTIFKSKFFINSILNEILENKYDIFIPQNHLTQTIQSEYNDQFAMGNYKSSKIYSNTFANISDLILRTQSLNSQKWLKYWLDNNSLKVNQSYLDLFLARQCNIRTNKENNNFLDE